MTTRRAYCLFNGEYCSSLTKRSLSSSVDAPLVPVSASNEDEGYLDLKEQDGGGNSQDVTPTQRQGLPLGSVFSSGSSNARIENTYTTSEEITVSGRDAPKPFIHFSDYEWPEEINQVLIREKFTNPTPIQCQGLPIALEGRDMVGIAQTGSGKTLSYILPAVVKCTTHEATKNLRSPFALVLAPTRELAQQINTVAHQFPCLRSACLYGGSAKAHQIQELRRSPRLIVATPGRLNDLVADGYVSLHDISFLVLDEADRMLDMGFEPQIRSIVDQLPKRAQRQTLMWSATWPEDVRELAEDYLNDFIQVNIGSSELHANHNIRQVVKVINEAEKQNELLKIMNNIRDDCRIKEADYFDKTLIFSSTKRRVDSIANGLRRRQFRVEGTHGDKSQNYREQILRGYRSGKIDVLVATDVAARGLDVNDIKVVINYDYPNTSEDYVHRIGRTARASNTGTAYTFFTSDNCAQAEDLINVMKEAGQDVPPELHDMVRMAREQKMMKKSFRASSKSRQYGDQFGGRSSFGSRPQGSFRDNLRDFRERPRFERDTSFNSRNFGRREVDDFDERESDMDFDGQRGRGPSRFSRRPGPRDMDDDFDDQDFDRRPSKKF